MSIESQGSSPPKPEFAVQEVDLKEIILVGVEYFWEVLHYWWVLAIFRRRDGLYEL